MRYGKNSNVIRLFTSGQGYQNGHTAESVPCSQTIEMFKDEYLLDFINVEELGVHDPQDYNKPMGVATYKVTQERLRELLPPEEEMKRLISGGE